MTHVDDTKGVPRTGIGLAPQVADYLRTCENRLARLRSDGNGPPFVKLGRSVRYRWEDVHRWVEENLQADTGRGAIHPDESITGGAGEGE